MLNIDYSKRLQILQERRKGIELIKKAEVFQEGDILQENYEKIQEPDSIKYILGAMEPVDDVYTKNTFNQGERIKNQLLKLREDGFNIEFEYQGSVTSNTHIRAHSDIDILVLHCDFVTLQSPLKPKVPYKKDPAEQLSRLREASYSLLTEAFPKAEVDNEGAKSISLEGGSLTRKIDVVPSNWYDTVKYRETNQKCYRGVMILDYKNKKCIGNTPFYHNELLADKDAQTLNNYKKIIRLLKTLKADAKKEFEIDIKLSSYDIAALMYHMENSKYLVGNSPLSLIENSLTYMRKIYIDASLRNGLKVPDESRNIFEVGRATDGDLLLLIQQVERVYEEIINYLKQSGSTIQKKFVV